MNSEGARCPGASAGDAGKPSQAVAAGYETYQQVWPTDPATGAGWTRAGVNAVELGLKAVA